MQPGAAVVAGNSRLLHFAPGTWLAIDYAAAAVPSELPADAIPVEVTGKWICFKLAGALVPRVIAAGTQLKLVLDNRDCAALTLFDCPVVVLRATDAFELGIHSSYADCLRTALIAAANAAANSTADD
jgi:sarcosine oxidase gamma subunit